MESPPSSSTWSEAFMLSDDSGLLLTNESASSGSMSFESKNGKKQMHFEDSDCEEKSLSQDDSLDGLTGMMGGENFNTLKKGPNWIDYTSKHTSFPIDPPPEFQDKPKRTIIDYYSEKLSRSVLRKALSEYKDNELRKIRLLAQLHRPLHHLLNRPYWTPDFIPFSPCHVSGRPSSRSSLGSSRLSSSHNSLSVPMAHRVDDSTFITQAVSHDTLSSNQISDLYNVPFDSDMYAVPVDVVKPPLKPKRTQQHKKKRRNTASSCREVEVRHCKMLVNKKSPFKSEWSQWGYQNENKRHSVAGTSAPVQRGEPIHMTLQEVRQYLQTLYSSSSDSSEQKEKIFKPKSTILVTNNNNKYSPNTNNVMVNRDVTGSLHNNNNINNVNNRSKKSTFLINIKNKKVKDSCDNTVEKQINNVSATKKDEKRKKTPTKLFSFKQTLCNMFRFKRFLSPEHVKADRDIQDNYTYLQNNISSRALPPLPLKEDDTEMNEEEQTLDFATSIQRVKDYGWYWGPISSEAAEKILSNEPDGSFIVRDSSDDHYIFSLTFKLNNCVRHVRIEHDQGNFSFGNCTKFKSQTIVEFIENAVEHSRSGRYLFFLHRRPVIGPVRVQLLHPVSRFKQVQSLQHMCRFVIHKVVRRDLIPELPLPRRMIDYLNTPHYYSEHFVDIEETNEEVRNRSPTPPSNNNSNNNDDDEQSRDPINDNFQPPAANPTVPVNNYIIINHTNSSNTRQS